MKKYSLICLFAVSVLAVGSVAGQGKNAGVPNTLRCEFLSNPIGIESQNPALSWNITDSRRGAKQTAYQLQVASAEGLLGSNKPDLWDSGKTKSDQSHLVSYQGKPLLSGKRIWWRVQYWDQGGVASGWSEPTWWEMGLLKQEEFKGEWISAVDQPLPEGEVEQQWERDAIIPEAGQWLPEEYRERVNKATLEYAAKRLKEAGPAYQMRREFDVTEPIRRARLYICTLGYHEIMLNGQKLDEDRLDPGWSHYSLRADYVVKDVTDRLKKGRNCLGFLLGNGRYHEQPANYAGPGGPYGKKPVVKAMLMVETESGKIIEITTDRLWKSDVSHITRDSFWVGEVQDARRLQPGWDKAGFDDSKWKGVEVIAAGTPGYKLPQSLSAQIYPPEKEMERVTPVALSNPAPGIWVFDMGRILVGNAEVKVEAPFGTVVSVRYSALLWGEYPTWFRKNAGLFNPSYADMSIAQRPDMIALKRRGDAIYTSVGNVLNDHKTPAVAKLPAIPYATMVDLFVTRGNGVEIFQRRFGYHAFRYVEVRGLPEKSALDAVTGVVLHTVLDKANRSFASSNPLFNEIEMAGVRTLLYLMHGHIQEGVAERGFMPHMATWNYPELALGGEAAAITRKMLSEHRYFTEKEGLTSIVTPRRPIGTPDEKLPGWMSISEMQTYVMLPWEYYHYYGDRREVEAHYKVMKRYIEWVYRDVSTKGYQLEDQYGDAWQARAHYNIKTTFRFDEDRGYVPITKKTIGTPNDFYATVLGYRMVSGAEVIATLLGHESDAKKFATLRDGAREFIKKKYYDPDSVSYCKGISTSIQGVNAMALAWRLADESEAPELVRQIKEDLRESGSLTTGNRLSYPLLEVLSRYGAVDDAYAIMNSTTFPSLAQQLSFYGTIPEGWGDPSLPHRGSPIESEGMCEMTGWFYRDICGLRPDFDQPGFKHFFVTPKVPTKLDSAEMEYQSPYGRIKTSWKKTGNQFTLNVTVPPNSTATVKIPVIGGIKTPEIREGKNLLAKAEGVSVLKSSATEVTCQVQAGSYSFSYDLGAAE